MKTFFLFLTLMAATLCGVASATSYPSIAGGLKWAPPASNDTLTVIFPTVDTWKYAAASAGLVNTTGVTVKAAAGASIKIYIESIDCVNAHPTIATEIQIRDGASGTVIWRQAIGPNFGGIAKVWPGAGLPGTANTLLEIAEGTATATTGVTCNLSGHTGL